MIQLKYYLIPMHKAAAWQVVEGSINTPVQGFMTFAGKYYLDTTGDVSINRFLSNTERDEWIAAVHKHLAEWAYGKEEVPEAVREADYIMGIGLTPTNSGAAYNAWREKWMKPRERREISKYLYEV